MQDRLENALALSVIEDGLWEISASQFYEANNGMFGGWTAAVLLKSVLVDERCQGLPSGLTVNFINRITPGAQLRVKTKKLNSGRTVTHWHSEITERDTDRIVAVASIVFAERNDSSGFIEGTMPNSPAPDTPAELNHAFKPPGSFGEQVEIIPLLGFPPIKQSDSRSLAWVRERSHRLLDCIQLTFLSDVYPPRVWYAKDAPCPMATLTLSIYFYATQTELNSAGKGFVLTDAIGTRGENSIYGSKANMWSEEGALLATTEQLAWFKD